MSLYDRGEEVKGGSGIWVVSMEQEHWGVQETSRSKGKKKKETGSTLSLRREPALLVDFNSQHGLGLLNTGN